MPTRPNRTRQRFCPRLPWATIFVPALLALALSASVALAGQIRESDLVVSSQVGKVATSAGGDQTEAKSSVHSIDIRSDSRTGDVNISGKVDRVTTQAGGQNTSANSAVGGVSVGKDR